MTNTGIDYQNSWLWQQAFELERMDASCEEQQFFKEKFRAIRGRIQYLVSMIPRDMPGLTPHDISHLDTLWHLASLVTKDEININPPEAFVLGCSILLHDAALTMAAYPGGLAELSSTQAWKDVIASISMAAEDNGARQFNTNDPPEEIKKQALPQVLRFLHAEHAKKLAGQSWTADDGSPEYLIEDSELRKFYGPSIGQIAHSHWWPVNDLEEKLSNPIGPLPARTLHKVDRLKIACILRIADALHIDSSRAPRFLRAITRPSDSSADHWTFQERITMAQIKHDAVEFTTSRPFRREHADAWWLAHDTLIRIDAELTEVDLLLLETGRTRFRARRVEGARSPEELSKRIETDGWQPVDTTLRISDVPSIVEHLGGSKLYGNDPTTSLRELIQNAADAVQARRKLEKRRSDWGLIEVGLVSKADGMWLHVEDNGLGMSERVLTGSLLDYGKSFWRSPLAMEELPGLMEAEMKPIGRFGIGFFSVFMLGSVVRVYTLRYDKGKETSRLLEFSAGTKGRPILGPVPDSLAPIDGGTRVEVLLDKRPQESGGLLHTDSGFDELSLEGLVGMVAPNLDVAISVVSPGSGESKQPLTRPQDWLEMTDQELLGRLDPMAILGEAARNKKGLGLLQPIRDESGNVYGRACIWPGDVASFFDKSYDRGVVTVAGLRAAAIRNVRGILLGEALTADRNAARPIAPLDALAKWASTQAELIAQSVKNAKRQARSAEVVLECGGSVGNLKIVRWGSAWLTSSEFKARLRNEREVTVYFEGEITYDENNDDVPYRDFDGDFYVADDIVMVNKHDGGIARIVKSSWPRCASDNPDSTYSNLATLLEQLIAEIWGDKVWERRKYHVVGSVDEIEIYRSLNVFSR